MADYTSTGLIDRVKRYAAIPAHQPAFPDADIREFLTETLQTDLAPFLISQMGEYLVTYKDIDMPADENSYILMHSRCWAGALRNLQLVDTNGNVIRELYRRTLDDLPDNRYPLNYNLGGGHYYIEGNKIFLPQITGTSYKCRQYFFARPGAIVQTADVGTITIIDYPNKKITVNAAPVSWTSATTYDIVQAKPQFSLLCVDEVGSKMSNEITFTNDLPVGIAVGDYLCATGESPVAQIPLEAQNMLCQMTAGKIMESLNDVQGMATAYAKAESMQNNLLKAMTPRNQGGGNYIKTDVF